MKKGNGAARAFYVFVDEEKVRLQYQFLQIICISPRLYNVVNHPQYSTRFSLNKFSKALLKLSGRGLIMNSSSFKSGSVYEFKMVRFASSFSRSSISRPSILGKGKS